MTEATEFPPLDMPGLPPEAKSVTRARHALSDYARRVGANVDAVGLVVSEAVSNSVVHGFPGRSSGSIEVHATAREGSLLVEITDNGVGLDAVPHQAGLGYGIPLMGEFSASLSIGALDPGTRVAASFPLL